MCLFVCLSSIFICLLFVCVCVKDFLGSHSHPPPPWTPSFHTLLFIRRAIRTFRTNNYNIASLDSWLCAAFVKTTSSVESLVRSLRETIAVCMILKTAYSQSISDSVKSSDRIRSNRKTSSNSRRSQVREPLRKGKRGDGGVRDPQPNPPSLCMRSGSVEPQSQY